MLNKFVVLGLLFSINNVLAAEEEDLSSITKANWQGEAELGFISARGNTNTTSINARLRVKYTAEKWEHQIRLESVRVEDNNQVKADRFSTLLHSKYKYSGRSFYFGSIRYEDDPFAGYDSRATEIFGYGRKLYQSENFKLNAEVGIGGRQTDFIDNTSLNESVIKLATDMKWKISDTSTLTEELFVEWGDENTLTESTTDLKVRINNLLAMKISLSIKDNSQVLAGKKHTDTQTAITLVYDF